MAGKYFSGIGDKGESIFGNIILSKSDPIFSALGSLDELNSTIGWCRASSGKVRKVAEILKNIQRQLYIAQAEIASEKFHFKIPKRMEEQHTVELERIILDLGSKIPEINYFIMPGAGELSARLDLARAIARRAEREVIKSKKGVNLEVIRYLNRLSSLLFVLARFVNFKLKIKENRP